MNNTNRVEFANTLRGFAALIVVISHYLDTFWKNRSVVAYLTISPELPLDSFATPSYVKIFSSLPVISLGGLGVALFFLISGFVIPFSIRNSSVSGFLLNRFMRIYPTYIIGFSITMLMLLASTQYFETNFNISLKEILIHLLVGARDILGSRNIDSIIWTLEVEVKFYIFAAFAFYFFRKNIFLFLLFPVLMFTFSILCAKYYTKIAEISPPLAVALTAVGFCGQFIVYMFIGTAIHFMYTSEIKPKTCLWLITLYMTLFLYQWSATPLASSFFVAWSYGLSLFIFLTSYFFRERFTGVRVVAFFANISYPLYIIHGVGGYVALRILLDLGFKAWASLTIVFLSVVVLSYLIHRFIERPTQVIGKQITESLKHGRLFSK